MSFRMPRKVKDLLIIYVKEYAKRILDSKNEIAIINQFNPEKAAEAATKAILSNEELTIHEKELIQSKEGHEKLVAFFEEKLVVNYFMLSRNIGYYEAKSLLTDKGVDAFAETRGIADSIYSGRYKDYKATEKQIAYIESFGVEINHKTELSGREASLIISCLKTPKKTKPAYYSYYIQYR